MTRYALGAIHDRHDRRDFAFSMYLTRSRLGLEFAPPAGSLRDEQSPVKDQGQLGACTGEALTAYLEYLWHQKNPTQPFTIFSALFLYYFERLREHTVPTDAGAMPRDGFDVMRNRGVCLESLWPYDIAKFADPPPAAAMHDARNFRIDGYHRIYDPVEIKQAIGVAKIPVATAIVVFDSFLTDEVAKTGMVPIPDLSQDSTDQVAGGHEILTVAYDDAARLYCFKNSWNTSWGDRGYGYLPYDYLTHSDLVTGLQTATL